MNCELYMIQTFKLNLKELILLDEDFMEELMTFLICPRKMEVPSVTPILDLKV